MSVAPAAAGEAHGSGLPRVAEVPLALVGLVLSAPIVGVSALAVGLTSGFPVFFRQARVGRGGLTFRLIKLRTMRASGDGSRITALGDPRVTAVGRVLRRTKLDELPELWNVLRGDMAFVGPRPEVPEHVDPADPLWDEVLRARPGVTDPMTLALRDEESLMASVPGDRDRYYREVLQPRKLRGYVDYLRRRTWKSDLRVIVDTLLGVWLPGRAASARDLNAKPGGSGDP